MLTNFAFYSFRLFDLARGLVLSLFGGSFLRASNPLSPVNQSHFITDLKLFPSVRVFQVQTIVRKKNGRLRFNV